MLTSDILMHLTFQNVRERKRELERERERERERDAYRQIKATISNILYHLKATLKFLKIQKF
jgi:hypothetical protein